MDEEWQPQCIPDANMMELAARGPGAVQMSTNGGSEFRIHDTTNTNATELELDKPKRELACPVCKVLFGRPQPVPNGTVCHGGHCVIDNRRRKWGCVQCGKEFSINGSWTSVAGRHFSRDGLCWTSMHQTQAESMRQQQVSTRLMPPQQMPPQQMQQMPPQQMPPQQMPPQ